MERGRFWGDVGDEIVADGQNRWMLGSASHRLCGVGMRCHWSPGARLSRKA